MKIIQIKDVITIVFDNGETLSKSGCDVNTFIKIQEFEDNPEKIKEFLFPGYYNKINEIKEKQKAIDKIDDSSLLVRKGVSVYYPSISEIALPEDLVFAILKAEEENDEELLTTYRNFWTLCCLNPDSRARMNLFWFLNKYEMTISKSGLFVAYRNVVLKQDGSKINIKLAKIIAKFYNKTRFKWKKSTKNYVLVKDEKGKFMVYHKDRIIPTDFTVYGNLKELYNNLSDEEIAPVYTDGHSHTTTIKIGEPVSIPRDNCDSNPNQSCSRGLHVAARTWLKENYFGEIGIKCLVNPMNVVAVP